MLRPIHWRWTRLYTAYLVGFLPFWTVRGFGIQHSSLRLQRPTPTHPSLVMSSSTAIKVLNWRVLSIDDDSPDQVLRQRPKWDEQQYRSALDLYHRLMRCDDDYVAGAIQSALNDLDHAYRLYGPESVICSFNGGKDAVVILHLVRAAHAHHYDLRGPDTPPVRPRVIYFDHADEFPEMTEFLEETVDAYDLDMIAFRQGTKFQVGLEVLVDHNCCDASNVSRPMAFVLGTRTSDPNAGKQGHFAPSSHYMPPFMRVNPILDWTYGTVWHFLRLYKLPYCRLYDIGYTSLGTVQDTLPCPALAVAGSCSGVPKYWPAYMLRDWDQERAGRISREKKQQAKKKAEELENSSNHSRGNSSLGRLSTFSEMPRVAVTDPNATIDAVEGSAPSVVSYDDSTQKTVGVLIIGDEILKGFTADINTQTAAQALRDQNVLLKRVVVVSDDLECIAAEIGRLQQEVDVIITSGGVGPTHDDVTIKSVAEALGCEMTLHEDMAQLLRDKMNDGDPKADLTEAQVKMATLPSISKLRYLSDNPKDWPVLQCRNVFILPGVPDFFAKKITDVAKYLSCQLERSMAYKVVLSVDENSIVPVLNQVVENHPDVSIGSYPFVSHPDFKTVITVEGRLLTGGPRNSTIFDRSMIDKSKRRMDERVQMALDELITTLPEGSVLRVDNDNMLLFE